MILGRWLFTLYLLVAFASGSSVAQWQVVAYYPAWLQGTLPADMVEYQHLTHINVAFAWPNADGSISSYSNLPYAAIIDAAHAAGKRIVPSMGGWGQSGGFPPMAADSVARANFVSNLVDYIQANNYDGVDLDWEFPANGTESDNQNLLVRDIRAAFDETGEDWTISMAVTISDWSGRWNDYDELSLYVDWYNMMAYDVHGSWLTHSGHNAPLYAPPTDYDGSGYQGVFYLNSQRGVPLTKINLGMPFYGRDFNSAQLYGPSTGGTEFMYNVVPGRLASGWTYYWDDLSKVPYLQNSSETVIATYDDTLSIRYKCEYAIDSGLRGVMIWAMGQDLIAGEQPLLETVGTIMVTTNVAEQTGPPGLFVSLFDNYPNPFNPTTTIRVRMATDGIGSLAIYDVLGREIAVLAEGRLPAGEHHYRWDAGGLAGGFYICRLSVVPTGSGEGAIAPHHLSRKLLLLR